MHMIRTVAKVIVGCSAALVWAAGMGAGHADAFPRVADETHAHVGYTEDSLPAWAANYLDARNMDFQSGPDADAWANDADPSDTYHHGCVALIGDTSWVLCPDGYTTSS